MSFPPPRVAPSQLSPRTPAGVPSCARRETHFGVACTRAPQILRPARTQRTLRSAGVDCAPASRLTGIPASRPSGGVLTTVGGSGARGHFIAFLSMRMTIMMPRGCKRLPSRSAGREWRAAEAAAEGRHTAEQQQQVDAHHRLRLLLVLVGLVSTRERFSPHGHHAMRALSCA